MICLIHPWQKNTWLRRYSFYSNKIESNFLVPSSWLYEKKFSSSCAGASEWVDVNIQTNKHKYKLYFLFFRRLHPLGKQSADAHTSSWIILVKWLERSLTGTSAATGGRYESIWLARMNNLPVYIARMLMIQFVAVRERLHIIRMILNGQPIVALENDFLTACHHSIVSPVK